MPTQRNKITTRQLLIILILITLSPAIRLFPRICSRYGGIVGWLAAIPAAACFFVLLLILNAFFKKNAATDLSGVFELAVGKPAAKILLILYVVWIAVLYFLYIRYYAERLLSSIYPNTNIHFFIATIFIPVFFALRGRIETLARFCEFSIILFTIVFIIFYLLMLPSVQIKNLLPVTTYDLWPWIKSSYAVAGIWLYLFFLFFLGDHVIKKESLMRFGKQAMLYLLVMTTAMLFCVIGSLGPKLAERMPLPFFGATKLVSIIDFFDRMEAILLSMWVVSDFIVISVFGFIIMTIIKKLFNISESKYFAAPVVMLGYAGSLFLTSSKFELEVFSAYVGLPMNIIVCLALPLVILLVGKLRRTI